jgi:multidrug efflux pump subunit AcrA (membrane-fusion protein)
MAMLLVLATLGFVITAGGCSAEKAPKSTPAAPGHAEHPGHQPGDDKAVDVQAHDDQKPAQDHPAHDEATALALSPQALKNIGFEPVTIGIGSYERTISLPGMVVERPGRTQIQVAAPFAGVVTRIYGIEGEAVPTGNALFDLRLTHEDLIAAQSEFLRLAEELDVVNREIGRLESITEGVVAGRRIVEQKYERQKLEAQLRAGRQALLLHGLNDTQVDDILRTRQLVQTLTIQAPAHEDSACSEIDHLFHVQHLNVQLGQQVTAGDPLCILADHCQLYIEGTAFEEDAERLRAAVQAGTDVSADLLVSNRREHAVDGLKLLYLSDQVDRESRLLRFYLPLPNEVVHDRTEGEHRFLQWRFKPGQRVELRVPVEKWADRLVAPAEAVVSDGAESYVYRQNGSHFDRVPVHVEYRDQVSAVLANDGSVFPGDVIAGRGAFQIHVAIKNKSGGGVDPHAGHSH